MCVCVCVYAVIFLTRSKYSNKSKRILYHNHVICITNDNLGHLIQSSVDPTIEHPISSVCIFLRVYWWFESCLQQNDMNFIFFNVDAGVSLLSNKIQVEEYITALLEILCYPEADCGVGGGQNKSHYRKRFITFVYFSKGFLPKM